VGNKLRNNQEETRWETGKVARPRADKVGDKAADRVPRRECDTVKDKLGDKWGTR
jgi:hypothetical protein